MHCLISVILFPSHYLVLSHKILGKEHVSMQLLLILTQMFLICMLPVFTEVVWHLRKHYALVWLVGFQHLWMYQSLFQFNPFTPRRDKHVTSPYKYPYIIQQTGYENTQIDQVEVVILIWHQILVTTLHGNALQLEGRIINQILGVKKLTACYSVHWTVHSRVTAHITFKGSFLRMSEFDMLLEGWSIWTGHVTELTFHIVDCK